MVFGASIGGRQAAIFRLVPRPTETGSMRRRSEPARFLLRAAWPFRAAALAALLLLVPTADARAQETEAPAEEVDTDDDPFDRPGFYYGVSGVYQRNVFENRLEDVLRDELEGTGFETSSLSIDDSGGVTGLVGYRAASFFAIELQYEWIDEYKVEGKQVPGFGTVELYEIESHTITANTKWFIPFWRIQPYLLVGGGYSFYDIDRAPGGTALSLQGIDIDDGNQGDWAVRAGGGIDWYLTEWLVFNTQVSAVLTTLERPQISDIDDLNYLAFSGGLQYRY